MNDNPLLTITTDALGLPPFGAIKPEHFMPAFRAEMDAQLRAIDAITANPEPASFANTIEALERAGRGLDGDPRREPTEFVAGPVDEDPVRSQP